MALRIIGCGNSDRGDDAAGVGDQGRVRQRVRLRTTAPDGDYLLDVGESVTLSDWAEGSDADGEIRLPAEALVRLFYGRLDPEHTPDYSAEGIELDRLRAVFPGF